MSIPSSDKAHQPVYYIPLGMPAPPVPMMVNSVLPGSNSVYPCYPQNVAQVPQYASIPKYLPQAVIMPQAPVVSHPTALTEPVGQVSPSNGCAEIGAEVGSSNLPLNLSTYTDVIEQALKHATFTKDGVLLEELQWWITRLYPAYSFLGTLTHSDTVSRILRSDPRFIVIKESAKGRCWGLKRHSSVEEALSNNSMQSRPMFSLLDIKYRFAGLESLIYSQHKERIPELDSSEMLLTIEDVVCGAFLAKPSTIPFSKENICKLIELLYPTKHFMKGSMSEVGSFLSSSTHFSYMLTPQKQKCYSLNHEYLQQHPIRSQLLQEYLSERLSTVRGDMIESYSFLLPRPTSTEPTNISKESMNFQTPHRKIVNSQEEQSSAKPARSYWDVIAEGGKSKQRPDSDVSLSRNEKEPKATRENDYNPYHSPQIQNHEVNLVSHHIPVKYPYRKASESSMISERSERSISDFGISHLLSPESQSGDQLTYDTEEIWRRKLLADYEEQHQKKISDMRKSQKKHLKFLEGLTEMPSTAPPTSSNANFSLDLPDIKPQKSMDPPKRKFSENEYEISSSDFVEPASKVRKNNISKESRGLNKSHTKPSMTYTQLIIISMVKSGSTHKDPMQGMSTKEICEKIMELYPYYRYFTPPNFMVVINGALNRGPFRKLRKKGTSCYWGLEPDADSRRGSTPDSLCTISKALDQGNLVNSQQVGNIPELFVPIKEFSAFNLISGVFLAITHAPDLSKYQVRNAINFLYPGHRLITLNKSAMHVMVNNACFQHVRTVNHLKHFKLDEAYACQNKDRAVYLQNRLTKLLQEKRSSSQESFAESEDLNTVLNKILNPPSPETDMDIPVEYRIKPDYSATDLIAVSLKSSSASGLSVRGICEKIMELFPYYRYCYSDYWRQGISKAVHCDLFKKVSCSKSGAIWELNDENHSKLRLCEQKAK